MMNDELLKTLRHRLQRGKDRLGASRGDFFLPNLRRFWHFVNHEPFLATILDELRSNHEGELTAAVFNAEAARNDIPALRQQIAELKTGEQYAAFACNLMDGVFERQWDFALLNKVWGSHPGNATDYDVFKPDLLFPFCDYLAERLDEQHVFLGLLLRYKHRSEWFTRPHLFEIAKPTNGMKRQAVEDALKQDLYQYLHDQGMDFTIEPYSHQGRIDLILDQKEDGRKYLEGKVFDNKGRGASYLVKGVGQLLSYLNQYESSHGYLFVFKICEERMAIEGADHLHTIPFVRRQGKTIFLVVVDIYPYTKPISQRTSKSVTIVIPE